MVVAAGAAAIAATLGCSREPAPPTPAATPVAAAPAATPAAPAVAAAPAASPLATADGAQPGLRIELTELKRSSGEKVNLKFVLVNDSATFVTVELANVNNVVSLIDPVGKKKYFVAMSEGTCVCSANVVAAGPRTRTNVWAKFPAPPGDVQRISVVVPGFSPMDDVLLS
jgi:hypothetical protein